MNRIIYLLSISILVFILSGCATVHIYSDEGLKNKSGLRFYSPKPYLLMELKSEKDLTIKTTIVYLPDINNPQYLKVKPGIGSNELKMAFTNGILNSYGQTSSSEIPEIVTSLASLIAKGADAVKQIGVAGIPSQPVGGDENFILFEIVFSKAGVSLKRVKIEE